MRRLALLAFLLVVLTGCGGGIPDPIELTATDDGASFELVTGQELVIRLESNQTTGFRWIVVEQPDASVLSLISSEYEEPDGGLVGEGGTEVWTFRAGEAGEGPLGLAYARPFEPDDVQGTFTVSIAVG